MPWHAHRSPRSWRGRSPTRRSRSPRNGARPARSCCATPGSSASRSPAPARSRAALAPPCPAGRVVVVGAGLAGLTAAHRLRQAGVVAEVHEASDAPGRPLLDAPGRLGRRPGRRARRRADRPGPHRDPPARPGARPPARRPARGRGQRDAADLLVRRGALHVRGRDARPEGRLAEAPQGRRRGELPDDLPALDAARPRARRDVDRRLDRGDLRGRHLVAGRPTAGHRLQHRVRRRVRRAELPEPPVPPRLPGPGEPADLRQVEREVPRARRQRPDPDRASARCSPGRSRRRPSSSGSGRPRPAAGS